MLDRFKILLQVAETSSPYKCALKTEPEDVTMILKVHANVDSTEVSRMRPRSRFESHITAKIHSSFYYLNKYMYIYIFFYIFIY